MKYIPIVILFFLVACKKDFLETRDTSRLNRQTYISNLATMREFVDGIQLELIRYFQRSYSVAYGDIIADNIKPNTNITDLLLHYAWSQQATDYKLGLTFERTSGMNGEWLSSYLQIRSCNFVIEEVDKYREENPARADNMKGQVYAIRAMLHFKLVNIFAQNYQFTDDGSHIGIPYITTSDITVPYKRMSVAEVYDHLIADLTEAIKLMPAGIADARAMNRDAAKALLARIYLFKGDYVNAKKIALEVAADHPLMTIAQGYPDKMYYFLETSQTESLYQMAPVRMTQPVLITNNFVGARFRSSSITFRPTQDIVDIMKENTSDIRSNWIIADGANGIIAKYPRGIAGINSTIASDYYQTVFRSSEMFLTIAEAAWHTSDENTARDYLNAIRKRADPTIADVTATGEALKDSIYKERRKELAFEGGRMYDLQRWHMDVVRTDAVVPSAATLTYPSNKAIAPIPIQEIQLAGIEQNLDY